MVEGRALLDHFVGSGKSLSVIIAGMESRRIGISRKNLYVVPNNMIQQWREEFKKAYPSANVLAVTERDFDSPLSRKRLFSRVATNEWDAVIVPHSQFDMLPISPEREAKTVNAQMQEMKDLLREGSENGRTKTRAEKRTTRQIENKIQKYKEKLKELSPKYNDGKTIDTINQKLGYLVRCGDPDAIDSIVPMAYGNLALDLLLGNIHGRLVVLRNGRYDNMHIDTVTASKKVVNVKEHYNVDRLRPHYKSFEKKPLFILTSETG